MADTNYNTLPTKLTPAVSGDIVLTLDSEDNFTVKQQSAILFKGPQGSTGPTGATGPAGQSQYTYIAYASDSSGTGASYTASPTLKYRAEQVTNSATPPALGTFSGWQKYIGDDGLGSGDMLKSIYDTTNNGIVDDSEKLGGQMPSYYAQSSSLTAHTGNTSNPHGVTKTQVGLENVDNTSDANKPVSTATQTALNAKANLAGSVSQAFSVLQLEVGHATDTTLARVSAGVVSIEGVTIPHTILPTTATDGATVTFNLATNNKHQVTIAGNRTLALSNTTKTPAFRINIKQDATGSRTVTWFAGITWAGGTIPTLSTGANKTDIFGFEQISAGVYIGFIIAQNI